MPWSWEISQQTLIIRLPEAYRFLSWASLGGGVRLADAIINHQVRPDDRIAVEYPRAHLIRQARLLKLDSRRVVGMMTGADVKKASGIALSHGDLIVGAWCTAGCSNALRIGDPASVGHVPGTINLAVLINQRLSRAAMVEALAMATEARVAAVLEAGVVSTRTNRPATGTGTDCIVIASPRHGPAHRYCGKHTLLGELIAKAVLRTVTRALRTQPSQT